MVKLVATCEIETAFFSDKVADKEMLKADPKGYIFSRANMRIPDDTSVSVVENGSDLVHLVLPYYASVDKVSSESLSENDMEAASGGEIVVLLAIGMVGYVSHLGTHPEMYEEGRLRK